MKEFKHLPGLDLIRVFGILVVVFYHYQVETAVRGLCPADFLPAMEPLVQVAVYTIRGRFVYTPKNKNKGIKSVPISSGFRWGKKYPD